MSNKKPKKPSDSADEYFKIVIERTAKRFKGVRMVDEALRYAGLIYGYTCGRDFFIVKAEELVRERREALKSLFPYLDTNDFIFPVEALKRIMEREGFVEKHTPPRYELFFKIDRVGWYSDYIKIKFSSPFSSVSICTVHTSDIDVYVRADMYRTYDDNFASFSMVVPDGRRGAHFPISTPSMERSMLVEMAREFLWQISGHEDVLFDTLRRKYEEAYIMLATAKKLKTMVELAI